MEQKLRLVERRPSGVCVYQFDGTGTPANPHCEYQEYGGTFFSWDTPEELVPILARYIHSSVRVRLFYGDREKGTVWDEDWLVCGLLGKTGGQIKIPILLANCNSSGGPAILDSSIMAFKTAERWVWADPKFVAPSYHIVSPATADLAQKGYQAMVYRILPTGEENVANFKTIAQAERWTSFMCGSRMGR